MSAREHSADCYLILRADTHSGGKYVRDLHIVNMRKSKPKLQPDEIAVKVRVRIPDQVFTQPPFEAEIVVPEQDVIRPAVTIEGEGQ
ncbi:UNVERIFIED_ORG: hypothetical protein ABID57_001294 [Arthrobacter sp. UYEF1]